MHRQLYLFQCSDEDFYGLTAEDGGANLPSDTCADGWTFLRSIDFHGGLSPSGFDVAWQERGAAIAAAIMQNGFFLGERESMPSEIFGTGEKIR